MIFEELPIDERLEFYGPSGERIRTIEALYEVWMAYLALYGEAEFRHQTVIVQLVSGMQKDNSAAPN